MTAEGGREGVMLDKVTVAAADGLTGVVFVPFFFYYCDATTMDTLFKALQ